MTTEEIRIVEESEKLDLLAATTEHDRLQKEIFPDLKLGLLHGRMRLDEKDAVMVAAILCGANRTGSCTTSRFATS